MSAFTPYEVLRLLVEKVNWTNERDRLAVLESIQEFERARIFGDMVSAIECLHDTIVRPNQWCSLCGKRLN